MRDETYNPLDKKHLAASVSEALLERQAIRIDSLKRFEGAGVYVLYYVGLHASYEEMALRNRDNKFEWPIYVGKAVPAGARKGGGTGRQTQKAKETARESPVFKRLNEHKKSIIEADSLEVSDFYCRYLIVDPLWIPLGESMMIAAFAPIWNTLLDGFGNHTPGKARFDGMVPKWDVMHPGRGWAANCRQRPETRPMLEAEVRNALRMATVPHRPRLMSANISASQLNDMLDDDET